MLLAEVQDSNSLFERSGIELGIYLLATFLAPLLSGGLMTEISIVGGFLIFASGLSILQIKEIKTMNLLPALFIPPTWFALIYATGGFWGLL